MNEKYYAIIKKCLDPSSLLTEEDLKNYSKIFIDSGKEGIEILHECLNESFDVRTRMDLLIWLAAYVVKATNDPLLILFFKRVLALGRTIVPGVPVPPSWMPSLTPVIIGPQGYAWDDSEYFAVKNLIETVLDSKSESAYSCPICEREIKPDEKSLFCLNCGVYYSKKFLDALGIDYHEYKQAYNKENRPLLDGEPSSIPFAIGLGIGIVATIIILFIPASPVSSPFLSIVRSFPPMILMIFILPSIIGYLIGRYLTRFFENQQYTLFIGYIDALIKEVDSDDRDRRNNVLEKLTNIFDKNFASTAEWSDWWRKRRGHSLVGKIWGIPDP